MNFYRTPGGEWPSSPAPAAIGEAILKILGLHDGASRATGILIDVGRNPAWSGQIVADSVEPSFSNPFVFCAACEDRAPAPF